MEIYTFTPDEEQKNLRIDKFLSEQLPDQSRFTEIIERRKCDSQ